MTTYRFDKHAGDWIAEDKTLAELINYINDLELNIKGVKISMEEDEATISGVADTTEDAERAVMALGNMKGIGRVVSHFEITNPSTESTIYDVQEGDSLESISKEHYGKDHSEALVKANKPNLKDPKKLPVGLVLRLPEFPE